MQILPQIKQHLLACAQQFGTPLYVYDANTIYNQYQKLKQAFSVFDTKIFYACKALTNINILQYLKNLGSGIDCSSINEVKLAMHVGFEPNQIIYTSNGISFSEICEAVDLGVFVNIDSISALQKFALKYGSNYAIGLRIRPNIMAGGNRNISTGHDASKFGIPIEQIAEVYAIAQQYNLNIQCLHLHTGSEINDLDIFLEGLEVLYNLIPQFPQLKYLDLGSGFKVPYKQGDKETHVELLAKKIKELVDNHPNTNTGKPLQIWFEPGKYLVSQCGYLLAGVTVVKQTATIQFISLNTGLNHLIRPMFYNAYHYIENISANEQASKQAYNIVGNICETDTLGEDRWLPTTEEGDILAICNAGAYGFEMSSYFNSRYRPAEVLIHQNQYHLIRKRDNFEDLLRNQISVTLDL